MGRTYAARAVSKEDAGTAYSHHRVLPAVPGHDSHNTLRTESHGGARFVDEGGLLVYIGAAIHASHVLRVLLCREQDISEVRRYGGTGAREYPHTTDSYHPPLHHLALFLRDLLPASLFLMGIGTQGATE